MERLVIAAKNDGSLSDEVSDNFGRCAAFCIAEVESGRVMSSSGVKNSSADFPRNAGTMAAGWAVNRGISAVIAGRFGPGSTLVLYRAGVRQFLLKDKMVQDAIDLFLNSKLECVDCSGILENMILQNRFRKGNHMNWTSIRRDDEHYICDSCGCMMPRSSSSKDKVMECPNCGHDMN